MNTSWSTVLLLAAVCTNGVAAGATLDQAVKQLPARRRIGPAAYLDYVRAADLRNGLIWYPAIGVGTAAVTLAAVIVGLLHQPTTLEVVALGAAAAGTLAHAAATSRAAPKLLGVRRGQHTAEEVEIVLDRFAAINAARAAAMVATLAATIAALALT